MNVTNLIVILVVSLITLFVIIHLIKVYRKSPCGDCASAKQCQAFNKRNIMKAYKKQCKLEEKLVEEGL
ncbi:MAG: hypothetical protein K2H02_02455 [Anaeroplasmataceae bacterium]|nr:hypothetical protein [Anaeroplasmataceae bacterium]MDE5867783.1 hypothetical protein [Anaeroplasmataceae bacterium]